MKKVLITILIVTLLFTSHAQTIKWKSKTFEVKNVTASLAQLDGTEVLKVERDLKALPFDKGRLEATVDEPTYVKLKDFDFENGTIEVKMFSKI